MSKPMFGWQWSDGKWYDGPEPKPQHASQPQPKPRRPWTRPGAFKTRPMSPDDTRNRCEENRDWLYFLLRRGPLPAVQVYRLAKAQGISAMGVRRAKKYHGIKTVKVGGRRGGYGARWIWHFPVSD